MTYIESRPAARTDIIQSIDRLPGISPVVSMVLDLTSSDLAHAADVATAVARDPALTARLLKVVNSAYFGFSSSVATVYQAVVILGFDAVRALTLAAGAIEAAGKLPEASRFPLDDFWHHSASVASSSRDVARSILPCSWGEAFVAGLLHDIGQLVLACSAPAPYAEVVDAVRTGGRSTHLLEREILGIDHAEVGGIVARAWGFPPVLVDGIQHHHDPAAAPDYPEVAAAVHVANAVAVGAGARGLEGGFSASIDEHAWRLLGGLRTGVGPQELARFASYLANQAGNVHSLASALAAA